MSVSGRLPGKSIKRVGGSKGSKMSVTPRTTNELAHDRTYMAWGRSVMALERTLMAWIRTSLSLIGFGFAIFKFLQVMQQGRFACACKCCAEPRYILHYPGNEFAHTRDLSVPESNGQNYATLGEETTVLPIVSWGDWCPGGWFDYGAEHHLWFRWILRKGLMQPEVETHSWKKCLCAFGPTFWFAFRGPMTFRLILQPTLASILAIRAGLKDARESRPLTSGQS